MLSTRITATPKHTQLDVSVLVRNASHCTTPQNSPPGDEGYEGEARRRRRWWQNEGFDGPNLVNVKVRIIDAKLVKDCT